MTRVHLLRMAVAIFAAAFLLGAFKVTRSKDCRMRLPQLQVEQIGWAVEQYRTDTGTYPPTLERLLDEGPPGLGPYLRKDMLVDPWGRPLFYRVEKDGRAFVVFSLGRDGRLGGRRSDEDMQATGEAEAADERPRH